MASLRDRLIQRQRSKSPGTEGLSQSSRGRTLRSDEVPEASSQSSFPGEYGEPSALSPDNPPSIRSRLGRAWTQKWHAGGDNAEESRGPLGLRVLASSPYPLLDLVFVHGLRGGSVKTWRKGEHPDSFWPQCWLPMEVGFENANIHSFGYDSDWGSTKTTLLNVHDFGRSLYAEMRTSPVLRSRPSNPIVLVGHSMGGLVIKKAFILAHQEKSDPDIAGRIRCLFFLATPHHGSDYAAVLNRILKVSGFMSPREYISDLTSGSTSLQLINEDFGRYADELPIYSFYETLPTSLGLSSNMIVDKTSAVLGAGYKNERTQYLNANHRDICKYESPEDSNYVTLRNSLHTAVQDLLKDTILVRKQQMSSNLQKLEAFLAPTTRRDDDYETAGGSCEWINDASDFTEWRDFALSPGMEHQEHKPSMFWVTAGPGSGKTVLANYIARQLEEFRSECASYYFHYGEKTSQSLAFALRSISFQMAVRNSAVLDSLTAMFEDMRSSFDPDDARAIWTQVFRACIFQTRLFSPQYWVLDAVDECATYADLFSFLKGVRVQFPLRIFITSRKLSDMPKLITQISGSIDVATFEIPVSDTLKDIESYVQSRTGLLPIDDAEEKVNICQTILRKSEGSFLWVRMVMDELEGIYGHESILGVLDSIPEGMVPYYQRTIHDMSMRKREKDVAKAALQWIVVSARPLTFDEIAEGLKLDIGVQLSARTAIEGLCGHFVSTGRKADAVRVVHDTAREFLFSAGAGEFTIRKSTANERMALACLRLLSGPTMQPPRHPKLLQQKRPEKSIPPEPHLLNYAIHHFSDHIVGSSSENDEILVALDRFLRSTITTWIRKVAEANDMHCLIRTARNLNAFLDRRAKYRSPLNVLVSNVDGWATDLSRLVTKFGASLTQSPASIHFVIPPLCPRTSSIFKTFANLKLPDRLLLTGFQNDNWDDCIATMAFNNEAAAAVSAGLNLVAVGFESGNIHLYNHRSCQKERVIRHDFSIDLIHFDPLGSFLVASSRKFVSMWTLKGDLLWKTRVRSRCILLTSSPGFIAGMTQQGRLFKWHPETGALLEEQVFSFQPPESADGYSRQRAPFTAAVSPGSELIALAYRNCPVCLFDFDSGGLVGWAIDEENRGPGKLLFNPNPHVSLLLVAYTESHLALYESWSGTLVQQLKSQNRAACVSVACSADGRTVAMVDAAGSLRLLDFESLAVLYHIDIPMPSFRVLEFSSDSLTLVEVVDSEMRFWSPSALVRNAVEEEASTSDPAVDIPVRHGQHQGGNLGKIRATTAHPTLPLVFIGTQNGDVAAYMTKTGDRTGVLYSHANAPIRCLAVSGSNLVASCDVNNRVQVWKYILQSGLPKPTITCESMQFQVNFSSPVHQLLFDCPGECLLVSTLASDHLYDIPSGALSGSLSVPTAYRSSWRWVTVPLSSDGGSVLGLIEHHELRVYSVRNFSTSGSKSIIKLDYTVENGFTEVGIHHAFMNDKTLTIEVGQTFGFLVNSVLLVFQLPLDTCILAANPDPVCEAELQAHLLGSRHFRHLVGFQRDGTKLVFLNGDSWICSLDVAVMCSDPTSWVYGQHFFVPNELAGDTVCPVLSVEGDAAFTFHDKVAIIQNGLKFWEEKKYERIAK